MQRCGRAVLTAQNLSTPRVLVGVRGDVDATNRHDLGRFIERHTRISKQLILDFSCVDFFGSQGFTALYYVSVQCARRDVDWMIVGAPAVLRILLICDPDGELPVVSDIGGALARLDHVAKCRHATEA
jgi:anti-anti-sigma factor